MDIDAVLFAASTEVGHIATGSCLGLCGRQSEGLLYAAPTQIYGGNRVFLCLAKMSQEVVQRQPSKASFIRT